MMNLDPRPVCNAILDIADAAGVTLSNLSLNKILFFAHAENLSFRGKPLFSLSFEAWQFGPVIPVVYHQFKRFGSERIDGRATMICRDSGLDVMFDYRPLGLDMPLLESVVDRYGKMSASALVALSHSRGGAWDIVWHENHGRQFGMTIPNELIRQTFETCLGPSEGKHVH